MAKVTPMMEQYFEIKERYKYCLLFFRLGDFYEMFFNDALIASKELEITLTGKNWGQEERAPMCGIPYHSADGYIARLVEKGYKVAICEQVEDPKQAKGIVKRDVVRVITAGTVIDSTVLDEKKNNYIASVYCDKKGFGLAVCDVTTGELQTTEFTTVNSSTNLIDELAKFNPSEIICNEGFKTTQDSAIIEKRLNIKLYGCDDWMYDYNSANKQLCRHFNMDRVDGLGLADKMFCVCASGGLLEYLNQTQKQDLSHIYKIKNYNSSEFMVLDVSSRRNLELTETLREKARKGSLLWVLDKTKTAMGARLIRKWVEEPLLNHADILNRLNAVDEIKNDVFIHEDIKEVLNSMYDFERIMSKVIYNTANCRDLVALKKSLKNLPVLKETLGRCKSDYLVKLHKDLDTLDDIFSLIDTTILDENPPFSVREGGMIRFGVNNQLDTLFTAKTEGANWISQLETKEKELTNIKNLKIRFNKVFGYYIEVTKSNIDQVPERYLRKQTLANCERYITAELSDMAELILGSEEKQVEMEYAIFCEVRDKIAKECNRIQNCATIAAIVDTLQSF
ncbi:MAG: DNA mismatch repair protein MutS, partial [Anaerotignaceae bacterium]